MHILFTIANNSSVPYFNWFAECAKRDGLRFTFVAMHSESPRMLREMPELGFDAHWVPFDPARRRTGMLAALPRLFKLIRRARPDVVHTHLFDDSVPGLLAARLARVPVRVITKQDVGFHLRYTPRWVPFDRFNNRNATHIHAVSETTRRLIVDAEGAPAAKVHVVRQGCRVEQVTRAFAERSERLRLEHGLAGRFVVGTVARFIDWKGHRLIVRAMADLVAQDADLLFVWAGVGELMPQLKAEVERAGLSRFVRFLGWVDREDMPSLYRCFDLYLHPAVGEPFGFAIAEAMMNGIPIAATRCGSTEELTHGRDGYILEEGSAEDVAKAIRFFRADTARRAALAGEGRRYATTQLSFERTWQGHVALYRGAVGR